MLLKKRSDKFVGFFAFFPDEKLLGKLLWNLRHLHNLLNKTANAAMPLPLRQENEEEIMAGKFRKFSLTDFT